MTYYMVKQKQAVSIRQYITVVFIAYS